MLLFLMASSLVVGSASSAIAADRVPEIALAASRAALPKEPNASSQTKGAGSPVASPRRIEVHPAGELRLEGTRSRLRLLVDGVAADGWTEDVTRRATFVSLHPERVRATPDGVLHGISDGPAEIEVAVDGLRTKIPVQVVGATSHPPLHFRNDVIPIFSRYGCNMSGCHGKAEGQNGFKLSVFGFDPPADRAALLSEGRGRRVNPTLPEQSLLLRKAAGGLPHGGGVRIRHGSAEYETLREWIAAGGPAGDVHAAEVKSIQVTPGERRMKMGSAQQLRVVATFTDGRIQDVTAHAKFQSNNEGLARVDETGLVTIGEVPGEAAIMAGYMGCVDVFRALIPRPAATQSLPFPASRNFIDPLVDAKLRKLNIVPSGLCDDAEFLRRVFLDLIGTLPTADEAREFLADKRPDRRALLVDRLLLRPEFADFWAMKWADLLHVDRQVLGHKGAYNYYRWIRDRFAANQPFDVFAREIVAAEGLLDTHGGGHLYEAIRDPGKLSSHVSQVFLGIRIECAQCHHHPFDRWSQTDYFGMRAHFTQASFKTTRRGKVLGSFADSQTTHPRTGEVVFAHPLGAAPPTVAPEGDRRKRLADWMTAPDNPWFARNFVNRVWAQMLGRGIISPVDDVRLTNPPSNPELLDALAKHFVESRFDIRQLLRTITASRTYQLSSVPNATNEKDEQNYSRSLFKRLDAEVLFDAVCQTTGVPEKFEGVPAGSRAIQLWDNRVPHYFLKLFGRPIRLTPCECERSQEPSVSQVLHVLNSPEIQGKLSHVGGRIAQLCRQQADDGKLVEELYLIFYSRYPTEAERRTGVNYLSAKELAVRQSTRQQGAEDIAWSMMNTVEFLFNH